ncbi:MAG TPA: HEAT repeat domain-containing protein [Sphingobium sp.]
MQARFFKPKPYEELFDLTADPDQITNRIDDPAAAGKAHAFRRALDDHLVAINDNGFIPEAMAAEGYVTSRSASVYPLKAIMPLASAAARRDRGKTALFLTELGNGNAIMRYWAATGFLVLDGPVEAARGPLEAVLRSDPVPQVRIVAAEALAKHWNSAEAVRSLGALVEKAEQWQVQLQALNALTYIGDQARLVLPAIEAASKIDDEYLSRAGLYLLARLNGIYTPGIKIFDMDQMMRRMAKSGMTG